MKDYLKETETPHYIQGAWRKGHGSLFSALSPLNNHPVWQAKAADNDDVSLAYQAAYQALHAWFLSGFEQRCTIINRFGEIVKKKQKELALLIALESGKPLWEAMTEVNAVIHKIGLSITAYQTRTPERQIISQDNTSIICYKPQGVIAVLGPFNFPAHLSNGHIVPALLAGNTVIYKPSELTPQTAQFIIQCWHDSGVPPGVINCIQGGKDTALALLAQDIQAVYFTGSYQTGLAIHQAFSQRPNVLLALEMGGNNPLIIDALAPDDIDAAVYQSILSSYITAGQRCTCARRLFIPDTAQGEAFLARFIQVVKTLRVGLHTDKPEPFMGPVIRASHAKQHLLAQQTLCDKGAIPILSMQSLQEHSGLLSPGIMDMRHVSESYDEEIFAPLVQIYHYHAFEEALVMANRTQYGLVAGLIGQNKAHYELFYQTIQTGIIHWNKPTTGALSSLPFGGTGQSGNHRPSGYFAADYCAYPVAIQEMPRPTLPETQLPGITI